MRRGCVVFWLVVAVCVGWAPRAWGASAGGGVGVEGGLAWVWGDGGGVALGVLVVVLALVAGWALHRVGFAVLRRVVVRRLEGDGLVRGVIDRLRRALLPAIPLLALRLAMGLELVGFDAGTRGWLGRLIVMGVVLNVTYAAVLGIGLIAEAVVRGHDVGVADNLRARRLHTQVMVLRRVAQVIVAVIGIGAALCVFEEVRAFGTTMLASAGVAGIVVGLAARPTLSSLIAGVQIALTQPIRLDDVVIIGGEWGRIEEITTTYVVVRVWDERRLIVPLSKVIDETFQNWTRTSAQLLGTVFVYADHTVDIDRVRVALDAALEGEELFDGRVKQVVVTDVTEESVQLRALVSAADAGKLWDLRCKVREALVRHLRDEQPGALPRVRAEVARMGRGDGG